MADEVKIASGLIKDLMVAYKDVSKVAFDLKEPAESHDCHIWNKCRKFIEYKCGDEYIAMRKEQKEETIQNGLN